VPTSTQYDHAAGLALLEAHGEVSREEAVAQFRAVCADIAAFHAQCPERRYGVLLDTRDSVTIPTPAEIIRVVDEIGAHSASLLPSGWAILASEPVHYGMGRLFQAHAEGRGITVRVFTTRESAVRWLSNQSSAIPAAVADW
jgi:hypothetical protein